MASSAAASFPCHYNWSLQDGLRAGYVTAGDNADCAGRAGSLTLTVRLLSKQPPSRTWKTVALKNRISRNLNGLRYVEVAKRCTTEKVRAVFHWTLRDPGGAVIARHVVRTRALDVPGPDCRIVLG